MALLDPSTWTWSTVQLDLALPTRAWHTATLLSDDILAIAFGLSDSALTSDLIFLDTSNAARPSAWTWSDEYSPTAVSQVASSSAKVLQSSTRPADSTPSTTSTPSIAVVANPSTTSQTFSQRLQATGTVQQTTANVALKAASSSNPAYATTRAATSSSIGEGAQTSNARQTSQSAGTSAGIAFGVLIPVGILVALFFWWRKTRHQKSGNGWASRLSTFSDDNLTHNRYSDPLSRVRTPRSSRRLTSMSGFRRFDIDDDESIHHPSMTGVGARAQPPLSYGLDQSDIYVIGNATTEQQPSLTLGRSSLAYTRDLLSESPTKSSSTNLPSLLAAAAPQTQSQTLASARSLPYLGPISSISSRAGLGQAVEGEDGLEHDAISIEPSVQPLPRQLTPLQPPTLLPIPEVAGDGQFMDLTLANRRSTASVTADPFADGPRSLTPEPEADSPSERAVGLKVVNSTPRLI